MKSWRRELVDDAAEIIEELSYLSTKLLEGYGYGLSTETHERAMAVLGQLDALRDSFDAADAVRGDE